MTRLRVAALAIVLAAASACGTARPAQKAPPPAAAAVSLVTVAERQVAETLEAGGVVRPRLTAVLSSRVVAPVVRVAVKPGDRVRAGQMVVALDQRQVGAEADRAAAMLEAARRAVAGAVADRAAADAALALARKTHARIAALNATRSATAQELDDATASVTSAEARLTAADARVAGSEASVTAATRAHDSARVARTYATLDAPFSGVVSARSVDPGVLASPGTPLLTIEADDAFRLEAAIDESRAAFIGAGAAIDVVIDQLGPAPLHGRVDEIERAFDPASHSATIKILLPRTEGLRSGMFGRARFSGRQTAMLVVPASSVVRRGELSFVYVAEQNLARLRVVRVALATGDLVGVTSGLSAGETIVRVPPPSLTDGQTLTVSR